MKYILVILYLSGYQPVFEHRWFDTPDQCSAAGHARITFLIREGLVKPIHAGCYEIPLQEVSDGNDYK